MFEPLSIQVKPISCVPLCFAVEIFKIRIMDAKVETFL